METEESSVWVGVGCKRAGEVGDKCIDWVGLKGGHSEWQIKAKQFFFNVYIGVNEEGNSLCLV